MNYKVVSFTTKCLVFIGCLILFNDKSMATYLEGVEFESGYRNDHLHYESVDVGGPPCSLYFDYIDECGSNFYIRSIESHYTEDTKITETIIPLQQSPYQFLEKSCRSVSGGTTNAIAYSEDCSSCAYSSSNSYSYCWEYPSNELTIKSGAAKMNFDLNDQSCWCVSFAGCSSVQRWGYNSYTGESSYAFRVKCEGEKIGRLLKIQAMLTMISEASPSPQKFLINRYPPTGIYQTGVTYYNKCDRVYFWRGALTWDIPINVRCGDLVTIIPSLNNGYTGWHNTIDSVRITFDSCEDKDGDGYTTCDNDCNDNDPTVYPGATELCDGKDNDCNGIVDDIPAICYTGPIGTQGVGICKTGTHFCENGIYSACVGVVTPEEEICDGVDNNCDGTIDEGCRECSVSPLSLLTDPLAIRMENGETVIYDGLTMAMQQAMDCFSDEVFNAGGALTITSAYRPPQYQQHLREVWNKYMRLTDEDNPVGSECDLLRNTVTVEFNRHGLLRSQQPAINSMHSQGIAIDARATLPSGQNVDTLANSCELYRPFIRRDPVHFELQR